MNDHPFAANFRFTSTAKYSVPRSPVLGSCCFISPPIRRDRLLGSQRHAHRKSPVIVTCGVSDVLRQSSAACKALKVLKSGVLKRLASGVQLPPWPPNSFKVNRLLLIINP